jgi:hypothetical protein
MGDKNTNRRAMSSAAPPAILVDCVIRLETRVGTCRNENHKMFNVDVAFNS